MAKKVQGNGKNGVSHSKNGKLQSTKLWRSGIGNSFELVNALTATMADISAGETPPTAGNSIFAGSRSVIKMLELQFKYGKPHGDNGSKMVSIGQ